MSKKETRSQFRVLGSEIESARDQYGSSHADSILRHIGLLEADEDKIQKIRPKGTLVTILYVPREAICPKGG